MHYLMKSSGIAAAIAFAVFAPDAIAQEITYTWTCQDVGSTTPEALGDREGHSISIDVASCHSEPEGPMSGAVLTGTSIWEWNGPNAVLLSANGVVRKPGATMVYQNTGGTIALTMTDGKVTGWTASGKGAWVLATGSAASMASKTTNWTAKPIGPGQFTVDVKQ